MVFGLVEIWLCKSTNWLHLWNELWSKKTTKVVELKYRQQYTKVANLKNQMTRQAQMNNGYKMGLFGVTFIEF